MRVIIIDRDQESLAPLVEALTERGFEVKILENSATALAFIKKHSLQFLLADSPLLINHTLSREVRHKAPLSRQIVLAAHPSRIDMLEAISGGLDDYFPRRADCFGPLVNTMVEERARLTRWQNSLLNQNALTPAQDDQ